MKRILVTGATGFLGGVVLRKLMENPEVRVRAACRDAARLPRDFSGEALTGDLEDSEYRRSLVQNIDAIAHTASWASLWRNRKKERCKFYLPTISLIDEAMASGVERFVLTGTIAMNRKAPSGTVYEDGDPAGDTGYWPHLDFLNDVDRYMKQNSGRGMRMVTLRLGHFVGPGNGLGLVPALVPRLRTRLVPHLDGGKRRMPLITPEDLADGFERALLSRNIGSYESLHLVGGDFPTMREILDHISLYTGIPTPWSSVPFSFAYLFAWVMEYLHPPLSGNPFLTRSIVHLAEGWVASGTGAKEKLGFVPRGDWKKALEKQLDDLRKAGYPWPSLKNKG